MTVHTLGSDLPEQKTRSASWLLPLIPVALAVFVLAALVSYHVRQDEPQSALQSAVVALYGSFGFAPCFLFFLLTLTWGSIWFLTGRIDRPWIRLARLLGLAIALAIWLNLRPDGGGASPSSGAVGGWIASRMMNVFGYVVSTLIVLPVALAAMLLATDFFFFRYFEDLGGKSRRAADVSGSLAGERGVETAVTEHLKGLGDRQREPAIAEVEAEVEAERPRRRRSREWDDRPAPGDAARRWAEARARADAVAEEDLAAGDEEVDDELLGEVETTAEADVAFAETAAEPETASVERDAAEVDELTGEHAEDDDEGDPDTDSSADGGIAVDEVFLLDEGDDAADQFDASEEDGDALAAIETASAEVAATEKDDAAVGEDLDAMPELVAEAGDAAGEALAEDEVRDPVAEVDEEVADEIEEPVAEVEDAPEEALRDEVEDRGETVLIPRPPEPARQRRLFGANVDDQLVEDAAALVLSSRRASATHLQRRLRIDYDQAMQVLALLADRGLIEIESGATQGRVIE